jgi:hypothetical protein
MVLNSTMGSSPARAAAIQHHLGVGRSLINEHQPGWVNMHCSRIQRRRVGRPEEMIDGLDNMAR